MTSISIAKSLGEHATLYPEDSTMGDLLRQCRRMIEGQNESMAEKDKLIKALTASETMRIEQLKVARAEVDRLKVFRANKRKKNSDR